MNTRADSLERPIAIREKTVLDIRDLTLDEIKQQFDQNLEEIIDKFDIAEQFLKEHKMAHCEDTWRIQIVFLDSAFDYYIHQITKYGMNKMFQGEWEKTDAYKAFTVKMEILEDVLNNPENQKWFPNLVNSTYERIPFMSYDDVNKQLRLIGIKIKDVEDAAFHEIGSSIPTKTKYKNAINNLYHRRNAIAHQSDRSHINNTKNSIEKNTVVEYITGIRKIVDAIHSIIENKNRVE